MVFSLEKMDELLKKSAIRCSVICVGGIVLISILYNVIMTKTEWLYDIDLDLFETVAEAPLELVEEHDSVAGDFGLTAGISGYNVYDDNITVDIFGRNDSASDWTANSRNFVLSSFNKTAAEPRYHYYPENWSDFTVGAGESYECRLTFAIPDAQKKIDGGYIFSISAFRNIPDRSTVEIIVNNDSLD